MLKILLARITMECGFTVTQIHILVIQNNFLIHKVPQALRPLTNQLCFIICELCYFFTVSVPCPFLGHVIPSGCL